ncbi:MAG: hypothetical protein V1803_02920 [Candidatus Roizmanbacteria bacterium]
MRKIFIFLLLIIAFYNLSILNQVAAFNCRISGTGADNGYKCDFSNCGGGGCAWNQRYVTIDATKTACCASSTSGCENFVGCPTPIPTNPPQSTNTPTPKPGTPTPTKKLTPTPIARSAWLCKIKKSTSCDLKQTPIYIFDTNKTSDCTATKDGYICCKDAAGTVTGGCGATVNATLKCKNTEKPVKYTCRINGQTDSTNTRCEVFSVCSTIATKTPTPKPGTPTPTKKPGTPTPTKKPTPTIDPLCVCSASACNITHCTFSKHTGTTYNTPIKCQLTSSLFPSTPSTAQKTAWCRRNNRTKGDSDGSGVINNTDYFYYVAAVNGGKIPVTVNPDFNGDGEVGVADRAIIIKTLP